MSKAWRWLAVLIAPLTLMALVLPSIGATAAAGQTSSGSLSLSNLLANVVRTANVLPGLNKATLLGAASPSTELTVDFGLGSSDTAAESSLLTSLYQKGSASFHQFLTPAEFNARFGVPAATIAATKTWLHSAGLSVSYLSGSGDLLSVRGTVAQLGALLHTTFGRYTIGQYSFVANQSGPEVPAALPITDVVGLNTLQRMWTESELHNVPTAPAHASTAAAATSYVGTLVPQDLWDVYDAPNSDEGQGETAGMFGAGNSNGVVEDLRVYEQRLGLPAVPVRVVHEDEVTNPPVASDNDYLGDDEWNLDTQAISGVAPKLSQLDMYFASTEEDADTAVMFADWAGDPQGPKQMNASFGECEADPTSSLHLPTANFTAGIGIGNQLQLLSDAALEQAVLEGRTLFTSAGDTGGSCPLVILPVIGAGNGIIPQPAALDQGYPCVSDYAVCVGGTVVTTNGTTNAVQAGEPSTDQVPTVHRVGEQSWIYTGGGPAANVPRPAYQLGIGAIDKPCTALQTATGTAIPLGTTCRGVPDVAAISGSGLVDGELEGSNAYITNIDMAPFASGGTSLSSPVVVGLWSRIQAASPSTAKGVYGGLGFANETFYAIGKGQLGNAARDFYDITSAELPIGNFYEQTGSGWDYTSGWGALDVANIIRDVDHNSTLTPTHANAPVANVSFFPQLVCSANLTSPAGNALDPVLSITPPFVNDTQLDITSATLGLNPSGTDLIATISGPKLSTSGPIDALQGFSFQLDWTYNGTTYFAAADINPPPPVPATPLTGSIPAPVSLPTGTVKYGDGISNSDAPAILHTDAGTFSNGTFTITVPVKNVGNPTAGSMLYYPLAFDLLPVGIFVPVAVDEANFAGAGQAVELSTHC
jgi:subtilase family serine protease